MTLVARIGLRGASGEPVDLRRTLHSHGVAGLPPMDVDADGWGAAVTLAAPGGPRKLRLELAGGESGWSAAGTPLAVRVTDGGPPPALPAAAALTATVRRMLCLEDDLRGFYAAVADDPQLSWAARGAGRMLRGATVFEDVVKTVCTTNCAWSATERMIGALVGRLGEPAAGAPPGGVAGRAFPTPAAMSAAGNEFYAGVVRAGYRGPYLREIARRVTTGEVDLEALLARRRRVVRRRGGAPSAGPARRGAVRGGPHDAPAGPPLAARSRLVDAPQVRAPARRAGGEARRRPHDRPSLLPLPRVRWARLLALPDARLGGRWARRAGGGGAAQSRRAAAPLKHRRTRKTGRTGFEPRGNPLVRPGRIVCSRLSSG